MVATPTDEEKVVVCVRPASGSRCNVLNRRAIRAAFVDVASCFSAAIGADIWLLLPRPESFDERIWHGVPNGMGDGLSGPFRRPFEASKPFRGPLLVSG